MLDTAGGARILRGAAQVQTKQAIKWRLTCRVIHITGDGGAGDEEGAAQTLRGPGRGRPAAVAGGTARPWKARRRGQYPAHKHACGTV